MNRQLSEDQLDAVTAAIFIARQIATGEEPALSNGWKKLTPEEANFYNDTQRRKYVPLGHDDREVLRCTSRVLDALGLAASMMLGLDTRNFVLVTRPSAEQ